MTTFKSRNCFLLVTALGFVGASIATAHAGDTVKGDLGGAMYRTPAITHTPHQSNAILPYVYADYGPFYARINTFGYKAIPLGTGHLEVATRISLEGYESAHAGIENRASPLPVGLGTFQKTAYGAFFLYDFYDTKSGGNLLDLTYAAKFRVAHINLYPQVGVERRSAKYVQHLYGVSASEASASGLSIYSGQNSTVPNLGLTAEYALTPSYSLTYQLRKKWLDKSITESPLVSGRSQITSFLALTRTFN